MSKLNIGFLHPGETGEFHAAAAALYRRMAHFKHMPETPPLEDVLVALLRSEEVEAV